MLSTETLYEHNVLDSCSNPGKTPIANKEECSEAATRLGIFPSTQSSQLVDDEYISTAPSGCIVDNANAQKVKFNTATGTTTCSSMYPCVCRRTLASDARALTAGE